MKRKAFLSFILGSILLFSIYHFPEFFSEFWIMAVFKIGFLIVALLLAFLQGWKGLAAYGLGIKDRWLPNLLKGLLIGVMGFSLSLWISSILGFENIFFQQSFSFVLKQLPMLLLMTAIPSVAEDILTRGYLYAHLGNKMGKISWIFLSAAIFVLNHIWRLNDGFAVITYLFLLGLLLAYTVWLTKSLWMAFGIHWGSNIMFESSTTFLKIESLVTHRGDTWVLAAVWGLFFLLMLFSSRQARLKEIPGVAI
ncbi:MAG: CPBP family glutamic-type intramembrane protease [Weeksellaceae bacterium]|nr:CPBP family intramembrane metalloprotease [Bacteroidota bacterium]MCG2780139.1 CPBP family glutamic-type intramembrane protease [Weeksellaceae bacterium]